MNTSTKQSAEPRSFKLVEMVHTNPRLQQIIQQIEANFQPGDVIGVEYPHAGVASIQAIREMLGKNRINPPNPLLVDSLPEREKRHVREIEQILKEQFRSLKRPKKGQRSMEWIAMREAALAHLRKDFTTALVMELTEKGFVPVGIDSYIAHDRLAKVRFRRFLPKIGRATASGTAASLLVGALLGSLIGATAYHFPTKYDLLVSPSRDRFMASRIMRNPKMKGAVVGGAHGDPIRKRLEQNGLRVEQLSFRNRMDRSALAVSRIQTRLSYLRYNMRRKRRDARLMRKRK